MTNRIQLQGCGREIDIPSGDNLNVVTFVTVAKKTNNLNIVTFATVAKIPTLSIL